MDIKIRLRNIDSEIEEYKRRIADLERSPSAFASNYISNFEHSIGLLRVEKRRLQEPEDERPPVVGTNCIMIPTDVIGTCHMELDDEYIDELLDQLMDKPSNLKN